MLLQDQVAHLVTVTFKQECPTGHVTTLIDMVDKLNDLNILPELQQAKVQAISVQHTPCTVLCTRRRGAKLLL